MGESPWWARARPSTNLEDVQAQRPLCHCLEVLCPHPLSSRSVSLSDVADGGGETSFQTRRRLEERGRRQERRLQECVCSSWKAAVKTVHGGGAMAKAAIQAQLDALLGKERNVPVAEVSRLSRRHACARGLVAQARGKYSLLPAGRGIHPARGTGTSVSQGADPSAALRFGRRLRMPAAACVGPQGLRPALCSVPTGRCASTTTKSTSTGCVAARRIFCSRIPAPTWARGSTSRTSRWVDMAVSVCERPASERALPSHARAVCTGEGGVGRAVAREARRVGLRLRALRVSPRPRGKA